MRMTIRYPHRPALPALPDALVFTLPVEQDGLPVIARAGQQVGPLRFARRQLGPPDLVATDDEAQIGQPRAALRAGELDTRMHRVASRRITPGKQRRERQRRNANHHGANGRVCT